MCKIPRDCQHCPSLLPFWVTGCSGHTSSTFWLQVLLFLSLDSERHGDRRNMSRRLGKSNLVVPPLREYDSTLGWVDVCRMCWFLAREEQAACAQVHLSIVWGSSTPLLYWRWKEKCELGFGPEVVCTHCAPKNPLWLVSLSSPFCDWWGANSPFFAVLLLLESQLCLGMMPWTPGGVSVCVISPQLSDEPLGASPRGQTMPITVDCCCVPAPVLWCLPQDGSGTMALL